MPGSLRFQSLRKFTGFSHSPSPPRRIFQQIHWLRRLHDRWIGLAYDPFLEYDHSRFGEPVHTKTVCTTKWNRNKTVSKQFRNSFQTVLFQFCFNCANTLTDHLRIRRPIRHKAWFDVDRKCLTIQSKTMQPKAVSVPVVCSFGLPNPIIGGDWIYRPCQMQDLENGEPNPRVVVRLLRGLEFYSLAIWSVVFQIRNFPSIVSVWSVIFGSWNFSALSQFSSSFPFRAVIRDGEIKFLVKYCRHLITG